MTEPFLRQEFPKRLRAARARLGHSQASMANLLGFSETNYRRLELGKSLPTLENYLRICEGMKLSLGELVGQSEGKGQEEDQSPASAASEPSSEPKVTVEPIKSQEQGSRGPLVKDVQAQQRMREEYDGSKTPGEQRGAVTTGFLNLSNQQEVQRAYDEQHRKQTEKDASKGGKDG